MVQHCIYDDDCDELNFCYERGRMCVEIGHYDPCRLPVGFQLEENKKDSQFINIFRSGEDKWLNQTCQTTNGHIIMNELHKQYQDCPSNKLYLPPLCPSEFVCSMTLKRCVRPISGQKLISIFDMSFSKHFKEDMRSNIISKLNVDPMDTSYYFVDDYDMNIGQVCKKDFHCPVGYECIQSKCEKLPGLHQYCSSKTNKCQRPLICSKEGICSYPCFDNFDCLPLNKNRNLIQKIFGLGLGDANSNFVCVSGKYCAPEDNYYTVIVQFSIIFPIILFTIIIISFILHYKQKKKKQ